MKCLSFSGAAADTSDESVTCPSCSSDHVIILPCEKPSNTSLPPQDCLDESQQQVESGKFYIGEDDNSETGTTSSAQIQDLSSEHGSALHSSSEGADGSKKDLSSKGRYSFFNHLDTNGGSLMGSYNYGTSRGTTPSQLSLSSEHEEHWNLSPRK